MYYSVMQGADKKERVCLLIKTKNIEKMNRNGTANGKKLLNNKTKK